MTGGLHDGLTAVNGLSKGSALEGKLIERHMEEGKVTQGLSTEGRTIAGNPGEECMIEASSVGGESYDGLTAADEEAGVAANHN